jgi:hypothetical protein
VRERWAGGKSFLLSLSLSPPFLFRSFTARAGRESIERHARKGYWKARMSSRARRKERVSLRKKEKSKIFF